MANENLEISLADYQKTLSKIQSQIVKSKDDIQKIVSRHKIEMAWNIGKIIGEYFVTHDEKVYGKNLIKNLAIDVGIDEVNLYKMRSFYKAYPSIPQDQEFNWTHYRILSGIKEEDRRLYFENMTKELSLNSRQLQDEINKAKDGADKSDKADKIILTPNRGKIFNYQISKINGRDAFFLDLGFGVLRDVEDILPESLKREGKIVAVNKVNNDYLIAESKTPKSDIHTYIAALERVVDGDTIRVSLDLGFKTFEKQILRIAKINAPELGTKEGKKSFKTLEKILAQYDYLIIKTLKTDIYGRYVADIFLPNNGQDHPQETANDGVYLNQNILDLGIAKVY